MTKRTVGFAVGAFTLTLLILASAMALFAGSSHAAAPVAPVAPVAQVSGAPAAALPPNANTSAGQPTSSDAPSAPSVSTWVDIAPFPTVTVDFTPGPQSLKLKRAGAAAYHPNGRIYVLGGRHGADGEDINMRNIFEYNPGANAWVQKTALLDASGPGERFTANMAVAVLTDTNGVRIYAIGGNDINSNPSSTVRIYNPVADTLSTLTAADNWPASPARVPGGYAVYENKLYIFGGFSGLGAGAVYANTWVFDPLGGVGSKWTQLTSNLGLARGYIAGATLDGKIYAIGGDTWNAGTHQLIPQTIVERYDPLNPGLGWVTMASIPTARGDMSAWAYNTGTGFEISGKVVIGGGVYPIPDNVSYMYSPLSNSWSGFPNLNHATRNYGVAQLNGILYAFGGYDYSNNIPDGANYNQKYDATGPTATPSNTPIFSPTATNTPFSTDYSICSGTGTIDPAPNLITGSQCGDCVVSINLPFAYTLYNQSFTTAKLSSNGSLGFTQVDVNPANSCLPDAGAINSIFGYWDDLTTTGAGNGIFTSTVGSAPNRIFNIEWKGTAPGGAQVDFEIRLIEGQTYFEIIYGLVSNSGTNATVGVQKDAGILYTQYKCAGSGPTLSNGQKLTFTLTAGVCPTNTPTFSPTRTPTRTSTVTGTPPTATNTPTPTQTPCGSASDYVISQTTSATIVAGTTNIGNTCDDCTTLIALPFSYQLYGNVYTNVTVSSNGTLQFASSDAGFTNACLPQAAFNDTIFPHWDDLRTDGTGGDCAGYPGGACGIFTSVSGSAPNRIFNIEWRTRYFGGGGGAIHFETRLYEGQLKFDVIYATVAQGGSSATVGVQKSTGTSFTQFSCNTASSLSAGLKLTFTIAPCVTSTPTNTNTPGGPTFTFTRTPTVTNTFTRTNTPTNTPTITLTGTPSSCGPTADYVVSQSTGVSIVPGTTDTGSNGDDTSTPINLPFPFTFYGTVFNTVNAISNGNLQFNTTNTEFNNVCLPTNTKSGVIAPYWDDLRTDANTGCAGYPAGDCGIFTSVSGSVPNRIFNIEWRAVFFSDASQVANLEARLYETGGRIDFVYGTVAQGGSGATIGVQRSTGLQFTQFACNVASSVTSGLQLAFTQPPCITNTPTSTPANTFTPTHTPTNTPTNTFTSTRTFTPTNTSTNTNTPTATPTCPPVTVQNNIQSFAFNPQNMTINVGTTVQWTNLDGVEHTSTSTTSVWDSGTLTTNQSFSFTFNSLGIFTYICTPHPSMTGTITVVAGCALTPTNTPTITHTPIPTNTPTNTYTPIPTNTPTNTHTNTPTDTPVPPTNTHTSTPVNTPTNTPVSTATNTPIAFLVGHVTWQQIPQPDARSQQAITLTLKLGATEVNYSSQNTDSSGFFTVSVSGLPAGTYDWRVKGPKWLANSGTVALPGSGTTQQEMGMMRAGDCNDSNIINIQDFAILQSTFGKSLGDPGYDARGDLNADNVVNVTDFNLLKTNFGTGGAPPLGLYGDK